MTRRSVLDYARAMRARYLVASKREKGLMLTEFCKTSGRHRKSAVRLLRGCQASRAGSGSRRRRYGPEVATALRRVWEVSDRLCSKRLAPFLAELVPRLERQGTLELRSEVRAALVSISPATIDRLLRGVRGVGVRRPWSQSPSSAALRALVPIRTFGDWAGVSPGSLQADLVAHCGESTGGFYLTTLVAVDVATSWCELEAVLGKGQQRVGSAAHRIRQRLPVELRELHTDNGGEFLNAALYRWCQDERIGFTRGRAYKKNDQAYAEQKNWSAVRRVVGYERYSSKAAYAQLGRLYGPLQQYLNFFQPIRKLVGKERVGAKVRKRYDRAQTPYQRLVRAGVLAEAQRLALERMYVELNPVELLAQIDTGVAELRRFAERPAAGENGPEGAGDGQTALRPPACGLPAHPQLSGRQLR